MFSTRRIGLALPPVLSAVTFYVSFSLLSWLNNLWVLGNGRIELDNRVQQRLRCRANRLRLLLAS